MSEIPSCHGSRIHYHLQTNQFLVSVLRPKHRVCSVVWLFKDRFLYEPSIYVQFPPSGLFFSDVPSKILHSFLMALMRAQFVADLNVVHLIFTVTCRIVFRLSTVYTDHWGDQDVDGRIILRWIFRKWEGFVGTGWSWLRIGTGGGRL